MKIRIAIVGVACLLMGLAYAGTKPAPDKHAVAGSNAGPEVAVPAPLATPDPESNEGDTTIGVTLGDATTPAATPVAGTPAPLVTPAPTSTPTPTPTPTPMPTIKPTPWPCGHCGPYPEPQLKSNNIMCPQLEMQQQYCVD